MKTQTVIWTALPHSVAGPPGGRILRLSVFVSPRLESSTPGACALADYPDFVNWPSALAGASFSVQFAASVTVPATVVGFPPNPVIWEALFRPETLVRPYEYEDLSAHQVYSYPAGHVMSYLQQQYTAVAAAHPDTPPSTELLRQPEGLGAIAFDRGRLDWLREQLDGLRAENGAIPPRETPEPELDFAEFRLFYAPKNAPLPKGPGQPQEYVQAPIPVPQFDFHEVASALGEYPYLLRQLGLVLDLAVPVPYDPLYDGPGGGVLPPDGKLRIVPAGIAGTQVTPWTAYQLSDPAFRAKPLGTEITGGMLNLAAPGFEVIQVDVDGAAMKALDLAQHLKRLEGPGAPVSEDTPEAAALPALRSAGFQVVRQGLALKLAEKFKEMKAQNDALAGGSETLFHAEHLVRGYRVDICDAASATWHSLCRRVGQYRFDAAEVVLVHDDEGNVQLGVTSAADDSSDDMYRPESLFAWTGWSLSAPRPGLVIDPNDGVSAPPDDPLADYQFSASFKPAAGSLPRLRYGLNYRVRARVVDLAGNSVPPDDPAAATATAPTAYVRFEPLGSPAVVLRHAKTRGESLMRMVIRSNYDADATATSQRHIAPPQTAQLMAETHGAFDGPAGLNPAAYSVITGREGTYGSGPKDADGMDPIWDVDQLHLPYLPDFLARGATLRELPGQTPGPGLPPAPVARQVDFANPWPGDQWPEALPFRIVLDEGDGEPRWDPGARTLTVVLPKAWVARVRLSSHMDNLDLDLMGLWRWLEAAGLPAAQLADLRAQAAGGAHWMLTPYRELVLVHAVQQPLLAPSFDHLHPLRGVGQTYAILQDDLVVDGKSTVRMDMRAQWQEWVDPLNEPGPRQIDGAAVAFQVPVSPEAALVKLRDERHEFGDTKHRQVNYRAVYTSRFSEYFRATAGVTLSGTGPHQLPAATMEPESETVQNADGTVTYTRGTDYQPDYATARISRVAGGAIADGQEVQVQWLPPVSRTSSPAVIDIPNAARPAAPQVRYIVPTFGWVSGGSGGTVTRTRRGGGLRVYLERPWFSSGDGELLGVILAQGQTPAQLEQARPYLTQWGRDPIWASGPTHANQQITDFPLRSTHLASLTLEEAPGQVFTAVGHEVAYDPDRGLWYCDVEIDAGQSYFPFVRLALARLQPISVSNAHLSRVALADFMQLSPHRAVGVTPSGGTAQVTVFGMTYTASGAGAGGSTVEVTRERPRTGLAGEPQSELDWVPVPAPPVVLVQGSLPGIGNIWSGQVPLAGPSGQTRLVIREYETYATGAGLGVGRGGLPTERRMVFAAAVVV